MKYDIELSLSNGGCFILFEVNEADTQLMKQNFRSDGERLTVNDADGENLIQMSTVVMMMVKPFKPDKIVGLHRSKG